MSTFKALKLEWYKKLKDSGFDDIEETHVDKLKSWHGEIFRSQKYIRLHKTTAEYYDEALEFMHSYSFDCECDKEIWELHCSGLSVRKIARLDRVKYEKSMVSRIIVRLAKIMKERQWIK